MQHIIYSIAFILAIIGAINWGLAAYDNKRGGMNLVHKLFGDVVIDADKKPVLVDGKKVLVEDKPQNWNNTELIIYALVAIAGVVALVLGWKNLTFKN